MLRNVIFDLGGVVIGRDFSRFGEKVGHMFDFFAGFDFPQCWKEFDRGTMTKPQVAKELAELNGCSVEESTAAIDTVSRLLVEIPETVELIKELKGKGLKVYVLSNMPEEFFAEIGKLAVMKEMDGWVVSYQEKLIKPDPRIFGVLMDRYSLEPGESLFVDDKQKNVDAAMALGMQGVLFTSPDEGTRRIMELTGLV